MHVQRIMAAAPISTVSNKTQTQKPEAQNVTAPFEANSSKASQIARNYFMASQMVNPAFTGFPCSTSNFRVKELEDMPCTCCGRPMMTNKQIDDFTLKASKASGEGLNQILEDHMKYFRAEEKAIVHYIQKQLKGDYPDADLTSAISRTNPSARQILRDEQADVLRRTSEISKELLGENNPVQNACERELNTTFATDKAKNRQKNKAGSGAGANFDRTNFLTTLVKLEHNKGIEHEKMHHILDVAVQLPESEKIIDKMLTQYGKGNSNERFAHRLIQKAVVTAEHIHPKSKGGPNATNNYMGECQECNGSRGNMSYEEWMKRYPNMPDNIQVHADAVTEEIIKGKIGGNYDDYPVDLKAAVESETEGKVVLTVKNPEEIEKAREERGLTKPEADAKEKANASGAYQGSYHGNPALEGSSKKTSSTGTTTNSTEKPQQTTTNNTTKSGKSHKGHKGGKRHHIVQFPSQMTQAEEIQEEVA